MTKHFCDRCKKEIPYSILKGSSSRVLRLEENAPDVLGRSTTTYSGLLCGHCVEDLKEWMK